MNKDFFKISDMSEQWRVWKKANDDEMTFQTGVQVWQASFLLAIAQQLSVVASHLGKIVRKAEEPNGQD